MFSDTKARAIQKLTSAIIPDSRIPQRVFIRDYSETFTMDFPQLLMKNTARIFQTLMQQEGSENVALACFQQAHNVGQYSDIKDWRDDVFLISPDAEPDAYFAFISRNWSVSGSPQPGSQIRPPWRVYAEVLGACSECGSWCVFGQMDAEIALLGFKQRPEIAFEERMYSQFRIRRLADALRDDRFYGEPGNEYSKKQRAILAANYL